MSQPTLPIRAMNKMELLMILVLLCFQVQNAKGQLDSSNTTGNIIYLEILGAGGLYSLNYERHLDYKTTFRVGASYFQYSTTQTVTRFIAIPFALNVLIGQRPHLLEIGLGASLYSVPFDKVTWHLTNRLGIGVVHSFMYRYQKSESGLNFRMGFTPVWGEGFFPYGGLSIGYSF